MSDVASTLSLSPAALAVGLGLGCSALWSLANVQVQRASLAVGNLRAMFWAQLVGSAVLLPLSWAIEGWPHAPSAVDLLVTAAASALGYYGMIAAFSEGALTAVVPVVTAWSVPAALAGVVWSGDTPSGAQWVGGALILGGALGNSVLATRQPGGEGGTRSTPPSAIAWAAAGALGFGVMAAGTARMRGDLGALGVIPATWVAQWVLLLPVLLARADIRVPPPRALMPAVVLMALYEGGGFVCFTLATRLAPVAVVSPPASLSALLTVLYGRFVLGEPLSRARWAFVAVAGVGMLIVARG